MIHGSWDVTWNDTAWHIPGKPGSRWNSPFMTSRNRAIAEKRHDVLGTELQHGVPEQFRVKRLKIGGSEKTTSVAYEARFNPGRINSSHPINNMNSGIPPCAALRKAAPQEFRFPNAYRWQRL